MSDDRLERALEAMKQEDVDTATLEAARARAWNEVASAAGTGCAEFRPDFPAYLNATLAGSRRVLMDDHLSRCPACRTSLATLKGDRKVIAMPQRTSSRWARWATMAAAAALVLGALYLGRDAIDAMMAPGGPRATVVSASGALYRLPGETLAAGAEIGEKDLVRTGPGAHAVLRLADGSLIDVNGRTELFVTTAWSGRTIHLQRGDVIVQAAKQRRGDLRVLTRDSIASVRGTVFAVSAGMGGSVVSVVEGSVAVNQPGREVVLSPGEQAASNPVLATSVEHAISWSPDAEQYLALLASFAKIERQLAASTPHELRTTSALLSYLPAGAFAFGSIPNLGGTIGQALVLAEQQTAENAAFKAWWTSETGVQLRHMVDRIRSVSSLIGEEVVFSAASAGPRNEVPMVMARVLPGKKAELTVALDGLFTEAGESTRPFSVSDDLMVVSTSQPNLTWALSSLGQGAGSPFAAAIGGRYSRGVGWLMAVDTAPIFTMAAGDDAPPIELAAMLGPKYVFVEQRAPAGAEENEVTLQFGGQRKGMASWLAESGSGGAAEYLPAEALVAGYVSMREPWQLFQEFTALMTKQNPNLTGDLTLAEEKLGTGYVENLTAALGTEWAFALTGFSVNGPAWVMAGVANNPAIIDSSLQTLATVFNGELKPDEQHMRIAFGQENAGGRTWNTLKAGTLPFGVIWTYDRGYLVAASDRASAERAIATRNGGAQLVWSPEFLAQLPSSAGMHPSAFGWVNAKGALGLIGAFAQSQALSELLATRDPVLVVFNGSAEQIRAASRTRLSGLVMNVMLLESLGRTREGSQAEAARQ